MRIFIFSPLFAILSVASISAATVYTDTFDTNTSSRYVLTGGLSFQISGGELQMNVAGGASGAVHLRTLEAIAFPVGSAISLTFNARQTYVAHELFLSADVNESFVDDVFMMHGTGGWSRTGQNPELFRIPGSDASAIYTIERTGLNSFSHFYDVSGAMTALGVSTTTGFESVNAFYVIMGGFRDIGSSVERIDNLIVTVPEPSTTLLGFMGVGFLFKRSRPRNQRG